MENRKIKIDGPGALWQAVDRVREETGAIVVNGTRPHKGEPNKTVPSAQIAA